LKEFVIYWIGHSLCTVFVLPWTLSQYICINKIKPVRRRGGGRRRGGRRRGGRRRGSRRGFRPPSF
jgi:hypothetical protein